MGVWNAKAPAQMYGQCGGAARLAELTSAIAQMLTAERGGDIQVWSPPAPEAPLRPGDPQCHHSYALWSPHPLSAQSASGQKLVWRMDRFLGIERSSLASFTQGRRVANDPPDANLLLLEDAGLGFRDQPAMWPRALAARHPSSAILLNMTAPIAQGELWNHLYDRASDNLMVVVTADDLRQTEVQISRELSWERTAQDVYWELVYNPRINALSNCAHVVVSFNTAGAVLFSRTQSGHACHLFFDPQHIEGTWEKGFPGAVLGYSTCLVASLARHLLLPPGEQDIQQAIHTGLAAMRVLHREGLGQVSAAPGAAQSAGLSFPIATIARELAKQDTSFCQVKVENPTRHLVTGSALREQVGPERSWTILQDRLPADVLPVAVQIVLQGLDSALQGVPLARFGGVQTVDRREIESLRSIRLLIGEYCRTDYPKGPLSIAVFGPPGSGKSFGITQVANSVLPRQIEVLEFNLSQFQAPEALISALHRVRDVGLGGKIPLVFWDEFDTWRDGRPLGWLAAFLAPMQDGKFQEGQITHPIGRAIFVFAGGTAAHMESFGSQLDPADFRAVKGPDFISRLRGYLNVLGPNPQTESPDPHYLIRRAMLLRSILQRNAPHLFEGDALQIHSGILRAFLQTRRYRHGVRSMEAIVAMSQLAGKTLFERSCLPPPAQLDLHVDALDFMRWVHQPEFDGPFLERLAQAAHEVFCEGLKARGSVQGAWIDKAAQANGALVAYADLSDELKEQNRANARDLLNKLTQSGYIMIQCRNDEPPFAFPADDLEKLAEMEHARWMKQKQERGWHFGEKADPAKQVSRSLVPWDQLSDLEKEKDRDLVRGIPRILARAGYTVTRAPGGEPEP